MTQEIVDLRPEGDVGFNPAEIPMLGGNMFSDNVELLAFKPEQEPGEGMWSVPRELFDRYNNAYEDMIRHQTAILEYLRMSNQEIPFGLREMEIGPKVGTAPSADAE